MIDIQKNKQEALVKAKEANIDMQKDIIEQENVFLEQKLKQDVVEQNYRKEAKIMTDVCKEIGS